MQEYEEYEEYEDEEDEDGGGGGTVNKILIALIILLLLAVGVVGFFLIRNMLGRKTDDTSIGLALTEDELAAAMEAAEQNAKSHSIALRFQNDATSEDGQLFECYLMNSQLNMYDMFIIIYGDEELTDELFTSGLIAPGKGFDHIKLNRALEKGSHTVYVVLTQVETGEDGEQNIVGQTAHTMNFHVE